jgi:hypothetical protein
VKYAFEVRVFYKTRLMTTGNDKKYFDLNQHLPWRNR